MQSLAALLQLFPHSLGFLFVGLCVFRKCSIVQSLKPLLSALAHTFSVCSLTRLPTCTSLPRIKSVRTPSQHVEIEKQWQAQQEQRMRNLKKVLHHEVGRQAGCEAGSKGQAVRQVGKETKSRNTLHVCLCRVSKRLCLCVISRRST